MSDPSPLDEAKARALKIAQSLAQKLGQSASAPLSGPAVLGKRVRSSEDDEPSIRKPKSDTEAEKEVSEAFPAASSGPETSRTHEMRVPHDKVGLIIGKGGETIRSIEALSRAQVQVTKETPGSSDRAVLIIGPDEAISRAVSEIDRVTSSRVGPFGSSPTPSGTLSEKVPVVQSMIGLVIGTKGETVKAIQARSGCFVQVQRANEVDPSALTRDVTLSGTREQIEAAKCEIQMVLSHSNAGSSPGSQTSTGSGRVGVTILVPVPGTCVGTIIGKGGESIKRMQQATGARIQMDKNDQGRPERIVTVSGSPDEVERAKREIESLILEKQQSGAMIAPHFLQSQSVPGPQQQYPPMQAQQGQGYYGRSPQGYYPTQSYPSQDPYHGHASHNYVPAPSNGPHDYYNAAATPYSALPADNGRAAGANGAAGQQATVDLPTPPTDAEAMRGYWAKLTVAQQHEYYRRYNIPI